MAPLKFLEQFDSNDASFQLNPPMQDLPGYDAGYQAGIADAAQQQTVLSAALIERLTEMRFGYAEAQHAMMQALSPFVSALSDKILPELSDDLTRAHLRDLLLSAAQSSLADPITLTFHPQTAGLVRDVLAKMGDAEVALGEDATLGLQEVYVGAAGSETQLDVASLITGIQSALRNINGDMNG